MKSIFLLLIALLATCAKADFFIDSKAYPDPFAPRGPSLGERCREVSVLEDQIRILSEGYRQSIEAQKIALSNNNKARFAELSKVVDSIALQLRGKKTRLAVERLREIRAKGELSPADELSKFAYTRSIPRNHRFWADDITVASVHSKLPVSIVPSPKQSKETWNFTPDPVAWGTSTGADGSVYPVTLFMGHDPDRHCYTSSSDCSIGHIKIRLAVLLGQYCAAAGPDGTVVAVVFSYKSENYNNEVVRVKLSIGIPSTEDRDALQDRRQVVSKAVDFWLAEMIKTALGEQQVYRVSDAVLRKHDGGPALAGNFELRGGKALRSKGATLREALAAAYDRLGESAPKDAELARLLSEPTRYRETTLGGETVLQFDYVKGEIRYSLGFISDGFVLVPKVAHVSLNDEILYCSPEIMERGTPAVPQPGITGITIFRVEGGA